jgi:hypothetical protein
MSNSTPVTAPAATVTLADGTVLTSDMSPMERHNAVAKSMGAPTVARPAGPVFGPEGHPPVYEPPQSDAKARQAALPAGVKPDAGPQPSVSADQVVQNALDRLNALYRAMPAAERDKWHMSYINDLETLMRGRRGDETLQDFNARMAGTAPVVKPSGTPAERAAEAATQEFTPQQWAEGHKNVMDKDGWIPIDRLNPAGLSGYTLPKLVENQVYSAAVFAELATARAAGLSQKVVTDFITAQMRRDGWIK